MTARERHSAVSFCRPHLVGLLARAAAETSHRPQIARRRHHSPAVAWLASKRASSSMNPAASTRLWPAVSRSFLERERWILVSPMRDVKLKGRTFLPRSISKEKVATLLDARPARAPMEQRDRAILELLYGTGIRVSEASGLDLTDINLKEATLLVRNGKGRKDRYVPIPLRAREALQMYLTDGRETRS